MIKIQELRKQDYKKARQFAIQGMHLYWYVSDKISLNLYARYFLDLELSCATRAYGAYEEGKFGGILLANMKNEQKKYRSIWRTAYIHFFDWLQRLVAGGGVETYDKANQEIYLYTDNACTYQFYEHRGFIRVGEQQVELNLEKKKVPLICFLYAKKLGGKGIET